MTGFGNYRKLAFAPLQEQRGVQDELLREHVAWCLNRSPFYASRLAGLEPACLTQATMASLPTTTKADLERCNDEFLAVPPAQIVDIVLSSGTTGKPTRIMYTERDLQRLAYNEEMAFSACGMTSADVVLLTCTMDRCFVAGLAYFLGIRSIGAAAIRNGHGSLESHLGVIRQMKPTALVGVPSFLRKLGQYVAGEGIDPRTAGVRRLICIGEPLRGRDMALLKLGLDLEALWGARVHSTYASSETVTTFCECTAQCGGHLAPELAVVEILDDHGVALPPGAVGEVTVTPLATEGMPLIRFRTGDISFLLAERCACGRGSPRLGPILGRRQQMLKVRGTTLYPQALYSALDEIQGIGEYYVEVRDTEVLSDDIAVHVALSDAGVTAGAIQEKLQARVRVKPAVLVDPEDQVRARVFDPRSRKPLRFFDLRKKNAQLS